MLAGCGGGNASSALSTRTGAITRDPSTADAATTTESRPQFTLTQTQTVQTQTIQTPTIATQTVQQTVIAPPRTTPANVTTTATSSSSGTPAWVWVLIAAGAVAGIVLLVWLIRGRQSGPSGDDRNAAAAAAVESWVAQGWAIESQVEGSTVLRRDGERMIVSVNEHGHVTSMPLSER
jgi:hypothetical protein